MRHEVVLRGRTRLADAVAVHAVQQLHLTRGQRRAQGQPVDAPDLLFLAGPRERWVHLGALGEDQEARVGGQEARVLGQVLGPVSYTHLTLPTNREV